jgi:hypothetical protein
MDTPETELSRVIENSLAPYNLQAIVINAMEVHSAERAINFGRWLIKNKKLAESDLTIYQLFDKYLDDEKG